jgi:hypothetical protein
MSAKVYNTLANCSANEKKIHHNHHSILTEFCHLDCVFVPYNNYGASILSFPESRQQQHHLPANARVTRNKAAVLWKTMEGPHTTKQAFKSFFLLLP